MITHRFIRAVAPDFIALSTDVDKAKLIADSKIPLSKLVDIINKPKIKNATLYLKIYVSNTLERIDWTNLRKGKTILVLPPESKEIVCYLKRQKFIFYINKDTFLVRVNNFNRTLEIFHVGRNNKQIEKSSNNINSDKILDLWKPIIWEKGHIMAQTKEKVIGKVIEERTKISGTIKEMYTGKAKTTTCQLFTRITLESKNGHNQQNGLTEVICFGEIAFKAKNTFKKGDYVVVAGVSNHFIENKQNVLMIKHQVKGLCIARAEKSDKLYQLTITGDIVGEEKELVA